MSIPYPGMDFTAFDVLPAADLDKLVANIEALANGTANPITLGYAQITDTFTLNSSNQTQVLGLSVAVMIPDGGRKIEVIAYTSSLGSNSSNGIVMTLWDGAVGSGTQVGQWNQIPGGPVGPNQGVCLISVLSPAAGSKTYNVAIGAISSGTVTYSASPSAPGFILAKAI